jgi:DNA-binding response OmpR family regulator
MSSNGEHTTVMRGVTHGACDFLIKPVRIEELRNIWQHVIRRSRTHTAAVRRTYRATGRAAQIHQQLASTAQHLAARHQAQQNTHCSGDENSYSRTDRAGQIELKE